MENIGNVSMDQNLGRYKAFFQTIYRIGAIHVWAMLAWECMVDNFYSFSVENSFQFVDFNFLLFYRLVYVSELSQ